MRHIVSLMFVLLLLVVGEYEYLLTTSAPSIIALTSHSWWKRFQTLTNFVGNMPLIPNEILRVKLVKRGGWYLENIISS